MFPRRAWALFLLAHQASAWNATGHRIASAIAYDRLSEKARYRVDALLAAHPDYASWSRDAPSDPRRRARAVFLAASVWPDEIRSDSRFYDDTRLNARPTPLLNGFPSMARHVNWHYIDVPISVGGAPSQPPRAPNALIESRRILKEINKISEIQIKAYDLPWLIHLEEDLHQPLHCVTRFLKSQPNGDAGGNNVYVTPGRNLHALWDGAAGSDSSDAYVNRMAAEMSAAFIQENGLRPRLSKDPRKWVNEGVQLAIHDVYSFGFEAGLRDRPIALTEQYQATARRLARARIALAGFRLAAVLNDKFR
ncbi:MAG TPA: S1/P1 nuclease [Bryobacteraceae bacterium]|nr:S1/P1 nuclease [Bryobacteraceae bacterium]